MVDGKIIGIILTHDTVHHRHGHVLQRRIDGAVKAYHRFIRAAKKLDGIICVGYLWQDQTIAIFRQSGRDIDNGRKQFACVGRLCG